MAGSEEYDAQLRIAENGARIVRLPEALFVRGVNTRRDATPIEVSMESAKRAIDAHLARCKVTAVATKSEFGVPGLFTLVYDTTGAQRDLPMTVMVRVGDRTLRQILDTANRIVPKLGARDVMVFAVSDQEKIDPEVARFLSSAEETVVRDHANIRVCHLAGPLGAQIQDVRGDHPGHAVLVIDPAGRPEHNDVATILLAMVHAINDAAMVAARTFWTEENGTTQLMGPLLFGASSRIGINRDGKNPGPGGWLAATQAVDGVDGPMVIIHPDAPSLERQAKSWVELCHGIARTAAVRRKPVWTPDVSVEIPRRTAGDADPESAVALALPYRTSSHHPSMSMIGDPLFLEGRFGLVDTDGGILLSGAGRFADGRVIDMVRNARLDAGVCASFSPDPIDYASIGRAIAQGRRWLRVNPRYDLALPGSDTRFPFEAIWTEPPPPEVKQLVRSAHGHYATSQGIANILRTLGARKVRLLRPKLRHSIWSEREAATATTRPSVMWIDEGLDIPWLPTVINATKDTVGWIVISAAELPLPGSVAQAKPVVLEEQWRDMFRQFNPRVLIRPTPGVKWRDDYTLVMGVAAGCSVLAGRESLGREGLPVTTYLGSDSPERWRSVIERQAEGAVAPPPAPIDSMWFDTTDHDWLVRTFERDIRNVA